MMEVVRFCSDKLRKDSMAPMESVRVVRLEEEAYLAAVSVADLLENSVKVLWQDRSGTRLWYLVVENKI